MTIFNIHNKTDNTPEQSKALLAELTQQIGFAPNVFSATAESPLALAGFIQMNNAFANSSFTDQEQQVILLAASVENGCQYCVAGHTAMAKGLNMEHNVVCSIREEASLSDERLTILRGLTQQLLENKGAVEQQILRKFIQAGYSQAQFFELVLGLCVKTFSNYVSNALKIPLDKAFQPHEWKRSQPHKKIA